MICARSSGCSEVERCPPGRILTSSPKRLSGQPGRYDVTIRTGDGDEQATVGAVVVATGWVPGDPARHESYGLGTYPNVVTTMAVEEMVQRGPSPAFAAPTESPANASRQDKMIALSGRTP